MSQWTWSRDVILKLNFEYKKPHYKQTSIYQHTPIEKNETAKWLSTVKISWLLSKQTSCLQRQQVGNRY